MMIIQDEAAMLALGADLAKRLAPGDIVTLDGPLGAGKTVLSRGILRAMGFNGDVTSPTFTIMHHYGPPDVNLALTHADLYRLQSEEEIEELGLIDDPTMISVIEWAERAPMLYGLARFQIKIEILENDMRRITIKE